MLILSKCWLYRWVLAILGVGLHFIPLNSYSDDMIDTPLGKVRSSFRIISYVGYEMAQVKLVRSEGQSGQIMWYLTRSWDKPDVPDPEFNSVSDKPDVPGPEFNSVSDELLKYISQNISAWDEKPQWLNAEDILPAMMLLAYEKKVPLPDINLYVTLMEKGRDFKLCFQGLDERNHSVSGCICLMDPSGFKRKYGKILLQCSSAPNSFGSFFIKYGSADED